jgi:TetR/AcrR family transcriptional repressor of nem operon
MAGRQKQYDEQEALDRAIGVFWEKGYEHASSRDLQAAMGIGKGSFYLAFKDGKQELFLQSMERFFALHPRPLLDALRTSAAPLDIIRQYYYALADTQGPFHKFGCYYANTLTQTEDERLKTAARHYIRQVADAFTEALHRAPNAAASLARLAPELWPVYFTNLWTGLNATRLLEPDPARLRQLIDFQLRPFE